MAAVLERDVHTIGAWTEDLRLQGPAGLALEQRVGSSPILEPAQQAELKAAIQAAPAAAGIEMANWNWKVVRQYVQDRFDRILSQSS